jgi:hypothetical protein
MSALYIAFRKYVAELEFPPGADWQYSAFEHRLRRLTEFARRTSVQVNIDGPKGSIVFTPWEGNVSLLWYLLKTVKRSVLYKNIYTQQSVLFENIRYNPY